MNHMTHSLDSRHIYICMAYLLDAETTTKCRRRRRRDHGHYCANCHHCRKHIWFVRSFQKSCAVVRNQSPIHICMTLHCCHDDGSTTMVVVLVVSTTILLLVVSLSVTAHAARHCHANVVRYVESVEQNDYHHWRMLISLQLATVVVVVVVVPVLGHHPS